MAVLGLAAPHDAQAAIGWRAVVLADGTTFALDRALTFTPSASTFWVIKAESTGTNRAKVTGNWQLNGTRTQLYGLLFNPGTVSIGGTANRITRCEFTNWSATKAIAVKSGTGGRIEYCYLHDPADWDGSNTLRMGIRVVGADITHRVRPVSAAYSAVSPVSLARSTARVARSSAAASSAVLIGLLM